MKELIEIEELKPKKQIRSFLPSTFVMASLPLREVKKNVFVRNYNNITMTLHSVEKVPYGQYGRLILSLLTTQAVLSNESDNVSITFKSLNELTDVLQLPRPRGKEVLQMVNSFVSTTLQYTEKEVRTNVQKSLFPDIYGNEKGVVTAYKIDTGNINFLDNMSTIVLVDENGKENQKNISFTLKLNEKFVMLCKEHAVPINYSVYKEITSPMGKDLYAWIVYRNNFLTEDKPIFIPKKSLVDQFNPVEKDVKDISTTTAVNYSRIKETVLMIKEKYYPELRVWFEKDNSGMVLQKSPAVILPDDKRYVLITDDI